MFVSIMLFCNNSFLVKKGDDNGIGIKLNNQQAD